MGVQISASKTDVLLTCPRPFDEATVILPEETNEAALYGSAWHRITGKCLAKAVRNKSKPLELTDEYVRVVDRAAIEFGVEDCRRELAGHVKSSLKMLRTWLKREKLEIVEVERAHAVAPKRDGSWTTRVIAPHDKDHVYTCDRDEVPGTVDLIARGESDTVVIDHKTGFYENWFGADETVYFALPTSVAQLRTLGLFLPRDLNVRLGIFHADRGGLPAMYAEPYENSRRASHALALYEALNLVNAGFLRPGTHCERCPARDGCPARAATMLVETAAVLVPTANRLMLEPIDPNALAALPVDPVPPEVLAQRAGALYDLLKRYRKLDDAATDEIRRLVRAGAIIETQDGRALKIRTQEFETISKQSIIDALGKVAGARTIARFRKKGALRNGTREQLVAEK